MEQFLLYENTRLSGQLTIWNWKQPLPYHWHKVAIQVHSQHFLNSFYLQIHSQVPKHLSTNQLAPKFQHEHSHSDQASSSNKQLLPPVEQTFLLTRGKQLSRTTTDFSKPRRTAKYSSAPKPPKAPHSFPLLVTLHTPSYGSTAMAIICTNLFPLASCSSYPKYPCSWRNSMRPWAYSKIKHKNLTN